MKKRLEQFYYAFGDRGVMFILFAFSVVTHSLMSAEMELPAVNPDEFGVASVASFFSGNRWSAMENSSYYYGYIQAIFYVPLFFLFGGSPYALYKSMLVMNGVLVSFVPVIAYHIASKLGVEKVWQKLVIALCSGFYISYAAHSKFIWNEAVCSLLPWLLIWCVFMAWDKKNKYSRFSMSVLCGFLCAVCYAAHTRLIAVVAALVITLIVARAWLKEKIVNLPAFFLTMLASFLTEHLCEDIVKNEVWGGGASMNTISGEIDRLSGLFTGEGLNNLAAALFGHLYTFMTSTLGMGALALVVFALMFAARIRESGKNRAEKGEDGTRSYSPQKRKYSTRLFVFGIYAFFAVGGTLLMSALFKFNSDRVGVMQDIVMFGRYTDSAAPLAIMLVLAFIFLYGTSVKQILWGAGLYAYTCAAFGIITFPLVEGAAFRESPIIGLLPWRLGEKFTAKLDAGSFVIMSSCVFSVFVLYGLFVSCSKRGYAGFISAAALCAVTYTTIFTGFVYLPMRAEENLSKTAPAREISAMLYNDPQSPPIVFYKATTSRTPGLTQFLNPDTEVLLIRKEVNIPENCLLVYNASRPKLKQGSFEVLGEAEGYTICAVGEGARDYIRYKRAAAEGAAQNGGTK